MASYRPFPLLTSPQSNFGPPPPNQTSRPPPPQPQLRGNMYSQIWNYPNYTAPPVNPLPNQQQQYSSYPPPPPLDHAYPPPPSQLAPPGQMYFPSSQYPQFNNRAVMVVLTGCSG
ncbi:hypothetical protein L1987_59623 [Smallanthus sonchifolius]|uniref:Uncharacterized protein n=1 Tax=Smallanthus sonchifolius TaxID=185202 RepID=A0ACB9D5S6_9ASTR|nr:hypothetical protein L1987_59623 [Smallanthus sonchifolius]